MRILVLYLILATTIFLLLPVTTKAQQSSYKDSFDFYKRSIDTALTLGEIDSANRFIDIALSNHKQYEDPIQIYFLKSRKMEVNYYYDLGKLGLIDAKKNLKWALKNGNSRMIMDVYNFTGLFHFMLGNYAESISSFKKGLRYSYTKDTLPFYPSETYHLQNNLAETYLKIKQPEAALKYCTLAFTGAAAKKDKRMVALSAYQIGNVFAEMNRNIEADSLFKVAYEMAIANEFTDVELICLGSLALSKTHSGIQKAAYIQQGLRLLNEDNSINSFYSKDFLKQAVFYFEQTKNYEAQAQALKRIAAIEDKKKAKELHYLTTQYEEVISENEKRLLLEQSNLQKSKEMQRLIIITSVVSILMLVTTLFIFFLRIKRKEAILNIRSAISRDLHDDIGSSLSSLNIYSNILNNTSILPADKQKEVINKINTITKDLLNNLHDIIWSLDKNKQQTSLEDLLKSYAMNMLTNQNIGVNIQISSEAEMVLTSPKARKNILMILKEIMNNCSKYSNAKHFELKMFLQKDLLHIQTKDDGIGISNDQPNTGNGLKNIRKRTQELHGSVSILSEEGLETYIALSIPVKMVRMKEYFLKSFLSRTKMKQV